MGNAAIYVSWHLFLRPCGCFAVHILFGGSFANAVLLCNETYTHERLDFPFCTAQVVRLCSLYVQKLENLNARQHNAGQGEQQPFDQKGPETCSGSSLRQLNIFEKL